MVPTEVLIDPKRSGALALDDQGEWWHQAFECGSDFAYNSTNRRREDPIQPVELVEVSPRDGLQNEDRYLTTDAKLELIARCVQQGSRRIEITSLVSPKAVPALADADELIECLAPTSGARYSVLIVNRRGFERALAKRHVIDEINYVIVASDTLSLRNQGRPSDQVLTGWADISQDAARADIFRSVTIAAAFGCPYEGMVDPATVVRLAQRIYDLGCDEISLADTIGVAVPGQVGRLVEEVTRTLPDMRWRLHLHNTRNTGYANAFAAISAGIRSLDTSLGGVGGCPFAPGAAGNIGTEDLIYMLERSGISTGLDLEAAIDNAKWLGGQLQKTVPGMVANVPIFPKG